MTKRETEISEYTYDDYRRDFELDHLGVKMNLLIHDYTASEWEQVADKYAGWTVISDNGTIRPCVGCFSCWTSGTGKCVIKDGYENMGELIHRADEMAVISRYTYGGFSSFVKNVFDRSLGYVLPEFETAYGEMHHKKRYDEDRPVTFCFRGENLSEEDKDKARDYVAAVCRNLRGTVKDVIFEECATEEPAAPSAGKPEERSGILLVDCSLRGARSNTRLFLKQLQAYLGTAVDVVSLSSGADAEEIAAAIGRAETAVLGVPLYVDGIPASALRLMETVKKQGAGNQCKIYAVVNNGLYESRQNKNLISMIRDWCAYSGSIYLGAAAIGAGEAVGSLMQGGGSPLWPVNNALSALRQLAEAIKAGRETDTLYADPYRFPRWMYIRIANTSWQIQKQSERKSREKETENRPLSPPCDYISFGRGKDPLIMIPGVGDGFKTAKGLTMPFALMYRCFAKDFKVYVFSRRRDLPEGFTTADMADDLSAIMDEAGIGPADMIGVSQGGMIAQQMALRHPEKVKSLVLAVTASRPNELMKESIEGWLEMAERDDYKGIMLDTAERSYTGRYLERGRKINKLISLAKPGDYTRFRVLCESCLEHDVYDDLDKIKCPVLIIGADQDGVLGAEATLEMKDRIKGSRVYIYEGYSHGVYEQAKDFNDRVLKYLLELKSGR